jgi:hypothetical protein
MALPLTVQTLLRWMGYMSVIMPLYRHNLFNEPMGCERVNENRNASLQIM